MGLGRLASCCSARSRPWALAGCRTAGLGDLASKSADVKAQVGLGWVACRSPCLQVCRSLRAGLQACTVCRPPGLMYAGRPNIGSRAAGLLVCSSQGPQACRFQRAGLKACRSHSLMGLGRLASCCSARSRPCAPGRLPVSWPRRPCLQVCRCEGPSRPRVAGLQISGLALKPACRSHSLMGLGDLASKSAGVKAQAGLG